MLPAFLYEVNSFICSSEGLFTAPSGPLVCGCGMGSCSGAACCARAALQQQGYLQCNTANPHPGEATASKLGVTVTHDLLAAQPEAFRHAGAVQGQCKSSSRTNAVSYCLGSVDSPLNIFPDSAQEKSWPFCL